MKLHPMTEAPHFETVVAIGANERLGRIHLGFNNTADERFTTRTGSYPHDMFLGFLHIRELLEGIENMSEMLAAREEMLNQRYPQNPEREHDM